MQHNLPEDLPRLKTAFVFSNRLAVGVIDLERSEWLVQGDWKGWTGSSFLSNNHVPNDETILYSYLLLNLCHQRWALPAGANLGLFRTTMNSHGNWRLDPSSAGVARFRGGAGNTLPQLPARVVTSC